MFQILWAALCLCAVLGRQLNAAEMIQALDAHWKSQTDGDVEAFVSHLSPDFVTIVNGEADGTPWTDKAFVQRLFEKVAFNEIHSMATGLAGRNSVIVIIEWDVLVRETFETLSLGEWQQTYTFNEEGKISKISSICDGAHIQQFSDLMSDEVVDFRPKFESLVAAFNMKNVQGVLSKFVASDVSWQRNGVNDTLLWIRPKFLTQLFEEQYTLKLDAFAPAAPRTTYAFMTWGYQATPTHMANIKDSWYVTWTPDGLISHVRAVSNGQEQLLYAQIMKRAADKLSQAKKDQLMKIYQEGSVSPKTLAVHLDL